MLRLLLLFAAASPVPAESRQIDATADAARPGDRADGSCMIVVATDAPLAAQGSAAER